MVVKQLILLFIIGAGLWACSSVSEVYVQTDRVPVTTVTEEDSTIAAFIKPYTKELSIEMDRVIGYAKDDLLRDRPEGKLGNFVVDATLDYLVSENWIQPNKYVCLMNHGGLRAPISKGDISVGDIYKLMPFDNTVVITKLPISTLDSICAYLQKSGGEPIAGFKVSPSGCELNGQNGSDTLYMVTTDYLFNGGDNMRFFKMNYSVQNTGVFLRDILLNHAEQHDTLDPLIDGRIIH